MTPGFATVALTPSEQALFGVALVVPMAVLLVVLVLLLTNARVSCSLPWATALAEEIRVLFSTAPDCPKCGRPGRQLGTTNHAVWWYCPQCLANPWSTTREPRDKAVAS